MLRENFNQAIRAIFLRSRQLLSYKGTFANSCGIYRLTSYVLGHDFILLCIFKTNHKENQKWDMLSFYLFGFSLLLF